MRSTLCYDQAIKWAKAKARVYSDSVLCLGKMHDHSEANEKWTSQIREFQQTNEYAELSGIDGEPIEFEWNIFPRFTSIEILWKIQEDLEARQINPEQLEGRILFMSMFNDMDRTKNGNSLDCILNSKDATDYAKRFQRGHGGSEEKWYGTYSHKPEGKWDIEADQMTSNTFAESGNPIFRGTSAPKRGILRRNSGRNTLHFTAESANNEHLLRTNHSANQLSIYGAVSSWCDEIAEQMSG